MTQKGTSQVLRFPASRIASIGRMSEKRKLMINLKQFRWTTVFYIALLPTVATAHHSFAATFDIAVVNELEGEVMSMRWGNPHVLFTLKVTDAQGKEVLYQIESHSLSIMRRTGVSSDALRVGDRVKVAGHPARRTANALFVLNALLPSGLEIVFDPFGEPRWGEGIGTHAKWQATQDDAQDEQTGIFRVWSTSLTDPAAFPFPETLAPSHVNSYPLTDEAKAALAAFDPETDIPTLDCAPKGMPVIMEQPYPMEIVDGDSSIRIHLEEYDTLRTVHMDIDGAGADQPLSRLGYSVGRWEGKTLVVETTAINYGHFDTVGIPLSDGAKVTEQFIPSEDGRSLNFRMTVTDPATFTEPVELTKRWLALPGAQVQPYECAE